MLIHIFSTYLFELIVTKKGIQSLIDRMIRDSEYMQKVLSNPAIIRNEYALSSESTELLKMLDESDFENARNGIAFLGKFLTR